MVFNHVEPLPLFIEESPTAVKPWGFTETIDWLAFTVPQATVDEMGPTFYFTRLPKGK